MNNGDTQAALNEDSKTQISTILTKLNEGMKIQESSANFMSFLIHDLLDYAQIKSGQFRRNVELFNIREAVE